LKECVEVRRYRGSFMRWEGRVGRNRERIYGNVISRTREEVLRGVGGRPFKESIWTDFLLYFSSHI
jgi:hypothetical protein